ncbi:MULTISPECIES: TetR/AcrR family transcriptional regulator [unclassified Streptomyces]|uniref:TetR/AcrR family transcriptional regulator n=1 Tax=unclassified Streptomyces TaxID=2593676 RepID=UPI0023660E12|nr:MULTISPECIES: TetR/AcrR family transcriptional regulator [unclassified Streptomyces]MDF3141534.1 TetR/AcrR family transcriptional regulator [Streptomyces sp. T21Q-yed]WDF41814.1 TetR/AcrR family transcriptional regulator [Streptomyces sp. T12]
MSSPRVDGRSLRFQHRRPELLAAATEYVLDHGVTDLSLRPVAQALGVTHATLLRHFSSKDELIMAVLENIRTDLATRLASDTEFSEARSTADLVKAVWKRLCEPKQQRQFLLLFELVGHHGWKPDRDRDLAQSIVEDWIAILTDRLARDGWPPEDSAALATLLLAQVRGLQLDLLVSGDRKRADRAIDFAVRLLDRPSA